MRWCWHLHVRRWFRHLFRIGKRPLRRWRIRRLRRDRILSIIIWPAKCCCSYVVEISPSSPEWCAFGTWSGLLSCLTRVCGLLMPLTPSILMFTLFPILLFSLPYPSLPWIIFIQSILPFFILFFLIIPFTQTSPIPSYYPSSSGACSVCSVWVLSSA